MDIDLEEEKGPEIPPTIPRFINPTMPAPGSDIL